MTCEMLHLWMATLLGLREWGFPVFFALGLAVMLTVDSLVSLEYRAHRAEWEKDGGPHGVFWRPPGAGFSFRKSLTRGNLPMKWAFVVPQWIRSDAIALSRLRRLRVCLVGIYVVFAVMLLLEFQARAPSVVC